MREEWSALHSELVERCQLHVTSWGMGLDYARRPQASLLENSNLMLWAKEQIKYKLYASEMPPEWKTEYY